MGLGQYAVVAADDLQDIEQLPLVLVHALDLNIKEAAGVHPDARTGEQQCSQPALVVLLGQPESLLELGFVRPLAQPGQLIQVTPPVRPDAAVNQARQGTVCLRQPATRGDAVGLVAKTFRVHLHEVRKNGVLHQPAVQGRDAIDLVAGQHRQVGHPDPSHTTLLNQ